MNKKEAEGWIVFFKKTTQGTMKIDHICKNEEDKKFLKSAMRGRRGLKSRLDGKDLVNVISREEQDGIKRELKEKIKEETQRRLSKLERAEPC